MLLPAACHPIRRSQRGFGRLVAPLLLALTLFTFAAPSSEASIGWCRADPGLQIGDEVVSIFISAPPEILAAATGPTDVVVSVPVGVSAQVLWTDAGFGYGETVTMTESKRLHTSRRGIAIAISVTVPATQSLAVLVEVVPLSAGFVTASASGSTNRTIHFWTTV